MKPVRMVLMVILAVSLTGGLVAQAQPKQKMKPQAQVMTPAELQWVDAPPSTPPGAKIAVLEGDPKKPGPFTLRFKLPADYKVPPHWHPGVEHVTVLSGTIYVGMGTTFDPAKGQALSAGSFSVMQPKTPHFAWTKEETILQLHGMGPWGITYINPADDPSKKVGQR